MAGNRSHPTRSRQDAGFREAWRLLPGSRVRLGRQKTHRQPGALRFEGPGDACRGRGYDRQRQDRPLCRHHRRGGHRRHSVHPDRSQRAISPTCCSLSRNCAARISSRGSTRKMRARRVSPSRTMPTSRPPCGRRAWPIGARAASASSACATRPTSRSIPPAATPASRSPSSSRSPRRRRRSSTTASCSRSASTPPFQACSASRAS